MVCGRWCGVVRYSMSSFVGSRAVRCSGDVVLGRGKEVYGCEWDMIGCGEESGINEEKAGSSEERRVCVE